MQTNKVTSIRYTKVSENAYDLQRKEITERFVIPIEVPGNIKAIDVSDLPEDERTTIAGYHDEYDVYVTQLLKTAFSFEDWLSQTKGVDFTPKWRTFKPEQTEIL